VPPSTGAQYDSAPSSSPSPARQLPKSSCSQARQSAIWSRGAAIDASIAAEAASSSPMFKARPERSACTGRRL
jgi:hypothetical protein